MELFYAYAVDGDRCRLDAEESAHCVRVLRHRRGDAITVIDGSGTLYHCRLSDDSPKAAEAVILGNEAEWNALPYRLTVGCCPTKNNERFEWFVEKATELGVDRIVPLIGERSERKLYKGDRARRIALSAAKQSLKARIPEIAETVSVRDFLTTACHAALPCHADRSEASPLRLIAYCFEDQDHPRIGIREALAAYPGTDITVLIGPEGDFSPEEARLALSCGYRPVRLGPSRLRTETAALTAVAAVYLAKTS